MIARIVLLLLAIVLLPQLYIDLRRRRKLWVRLLSWILTLLMTVWTVLLARGNDFVPDDMTAVNIYLLVFCAWFVPKAVYALCSVIGRVVMKLRRKRQNWGNLVGLVLAFFVSYIVLYGSFIGVRKLNVKRVEISLKNLPEGFDGYKIVFFSDAHVGSFTGWRKSLLQRDVDSINAQQADVILYGGDLQNLRPSEVYPVMDILRQLKAPDGVYSVLGNHDYGLYTHDDPAVKVANERELQSRQQQMGWKLLMNGASPLTPLRKERGTLKGKGRLVIAGMENYGLWKESQRGDLAKTLDSVGKDDCVILLQHDPSAWKRKILPEHRVALTLSGHTHGGQFSLFGQRFSQLWEEHDYGLFRDGDSQLLVSCGLGALLPFRFGMTAEIVVITLKVKSEE